MHCDRLAKRVAARFLLCGESIIPVSFTSVFRGAACGYLKILFLPILGPTMLERPSITLASKDNPYSVCLMVIFLFPSFPLD